MKIINKSGLEKIGNILDNAVSRGIEKRYEAPILSGSPERDIWYRIPLAAGMSGDGTGYHIYLKTGFLNKLCIFLSGGGVAWNEYTAARPVTGGAVAAHLPNFYWNNLRPMTQIMNINNGITDIKNAENPFKDWNFIIITYATGDFHTGDNDYHYRNENGEDEVLHFHGLKNFLAGMRVAKEYFPSPESLLIAGDSAGAFAVPAVSDRILSVFYPACKDVTLFSDSGQLIYNRWRTTARDIWHAPSDIWSPVKTGNITADWYRALYKKYGDTLRYLYAGSPRDYLLSAYYNDVVTHRYSSDPQVQEKYRQNMRVMLRELKEITPHFGFFIYNWPSLRISGGTAHTSVRHHTFFMRTKSGVSMAEWLLGSVCGDVRDINLDLMKVKS